MRPFKGVPALTGITALPFLPGTNKMRYMWRDIERRAAAYLGAAYRLWFGEGLGNGGEENLRAALAEAGQAGEVERILALAESDEVIAALDAETDTARALGLFGSPSFVVDGEVFWGDDHLEDAIAWARYGKL